MVYQHKVVSKLHRQGQGTIHIDIYRIKDIKYGYGLVLLGFEYFQLKYQDSYCTIFVSPHKHTLDI